MSSLVNLKWSLLKVPLDYLCKSVISSYFYENISKKVIFKSNRLDFFFFCFFFFFFFIKQLKQNFLIFLNFQTGSKFLIIIFNVGTNKGPEFNFSSSHMEINFRTERLLGMDFTFAVQGT
jgi:hypothetical protein